VIELVPFWALRLATRIAEQARAHESLLAWRSLEIMVGELGCGEQGGNNGGPDVARYKGLAPNAPGNLGAWCASSVSWCMERAGGPNPLGIDAKAWERHRHGAKWLFRAIGKAGSFVTAPAPGDVFCLHRGAQGSWQGHIGFVAAVEGRRIHTVEGNRGPYPARVGRFVRDLDSPQLRLLGFARMP